ncbi:site-specific integrase [Thauera sp. JM12B12]|uniref:site-specific integrase n=1 Tax=Thauera sp. JM12B12 TaxID=3142262 RepID=UPI0031F45B3D
MTSNHLARSRHGSVFFFRRRIPRDLQDCFSQSTVIQSLRTTDRRTAIIRARARAALTDALFQLLRALSPSQRMKIRPLTIRAQLSDWGAHHIDVEAEPHELDAVTRIIEVLRQPATTVQTIVPQAFQPSQAVIPGKSISETYEDYKAEKISGNSWADGENTSRNDHWPHIRAFINLVGDIPINAVTADDVEEFQGEVLTSTTGGAPRNREKRLTRAGALFRWAKGKRRIPDDFSELFRYPGKIDENPYHRFQLDDLKALFESDEYRYGTFGTQSEFWLPLLGLFTGARLNELCQLTVSDIGTHDGIETISILDNDFNKRLKNTASRRIIPIHSKLIELGFLSYAGAVGQGRLFPELPENPARTGDFTKEPSRRFTAYRRKCGIGSDLTEKDGAPSGRSNKTFHSFRSTLISAMRLKDVPKDRRTRLAGHEYSDTQDRHYTGGDVLTMFAFESLKADIEKVQFDVNFYPPKQIRALIHRK